jgi:conjugal transfer pilus assembly protein TrbC
MKATTVLWAGLCLVALGSGAMQAWGQQPQSQGQSQTRQQMPTAADIKQIPLPSEEAMRKAMEEARRKALTTGKEHMDAAARRADVQLDPAAVARGMPKGDLQAVPMLNTGKVDPLDLAKQYKQISGTVSEDDRFNVLVFVSLTMPEEALRRIGQDAKKIGAVVVMRGMKYGLKPGTWADSLEAIKPLASTGANVQINPELFKQFGIRAVPTFAVSATPVGDKGCGDGACAAGIATVVGDVTMEYALGMIGDRRDAVGRIARQMSERLD